MSEEFRTNWVYKARYISSVIFFDLTHLQMGFAPSGAYPRGPTTGIVLLENKPMQPSTGQMFILLTMDLGKTLMCFQYIGLWVVYIYHKFHRGTRTRRCFMLINSTSPDQENRWMVLKGGPQFPSPRHSL
ncbi:uncharacterized protein [Argopecten irradians]|uniref:uncharacterized protein n=1 Tax=Argopecten irradians TaxID=31199 RepID=UPI00371E0923